MFNAANILEALKNYIHTRGGTSNAYNIAEAVNDLNSIPQGSGGGIPEAPIDGKQYARKDAEWSEVQSSGADIPDEVTNAIETHGMGWTSEEEVEGFDIQWDGNTEGLDNIGNALYKVTSEVYDIASKDNLIGAKIELTGVEEIPSPYTLSVDDISTEDGRIFICSVDGLHFAIAIEDGEGSFAQVTKGVWFFRTIEGGYISRLYKEASTEEVVHQIDQKYIPQSSGGAMVVKVTADPETLALSADKTFAEIQEAFRAGVNVVAKLYVGEEFDGVTASCVDSGEISAHFGRVFIDEETSEIKYEFECWSDGVDEWTAAGI